MVVEIESGFIANDDGLNSSCDTCFVGDVGVCDGGSSVGDTCHQDLDTLQEGSDSFELIEVIDLHEGRVECVFGLPEVCTDVAVECSSYDLGFGSGKIEGQHGSSISLEGYPGRVLSKL